METTENNNGPKRYWMSLEQWRNDPEFQKMAEKEFQSSPLQSDEGKDGWARREFLKLMGASLAMTTFGCVRRPAQKIIPYAKKPLDVIHGIPNYYASSYTDGMEGIGILVTTRDGRPLKVEGNTEHPANKGGMSARAHAHILKLYDPDRFTGPKHNLQNKERTNRETVGLKWEELDKAVVDQLKKGKVGLLMSTCLSPTTQELVSEFASASGAKLYRYDDISYDSHAAAQKASYGQEIIPSYRLDKAKYIVAINNDFLGTWLTPVAFNRGFSEKRRDIEDMNKLVVFEPLMTLTGMNADQRFRIRPSQSLDVVMALINEIVNVKKQSRYSHDDRVLHALSGFARNQSDLGFNVSEVADDLWKNRGKSLVLAGGLSADTEEAVELQVAVNFLNAILENDGKTVLGSAPIVANAKGGGIGDLISALNKKEIKTVIIHGCNPAYSLPASAKFFEALSNAELIISTADRNEETARLADYVATDHHMMENWGDMQSYAGVLSIQQPTIRPLYDTRAFQDSLMAWTKGLGKGSARLKKANSWYDYLEAHWREAVYPAHKGGKDFQDWWVDVLQSGVVVSGNGEGKARTLASDPLKMTKVPARKTGFELVLYSTIGLGDGNLANVPWLQEFPDPVTKLVWDNYASFSPKDAQQLKLKDGQIVKITCGESDLEVPAHIQPGQADGVVGLAVGYGRSGAGKVADDVGVNAFKLAKYNNGTRVTSGLEVSVTPLSNSSYLACTQGHNSMEGRQIVVEETLDDHQRKPGGNIERPKVTTMWSKYEYKGNKWGMVIDLNTCTGCGACMIACQSENNVPTVGKKYVLRNREMHWLRIDRYYTGTPEDPGVVTMPVPCMHCENAPCETVCPVAATNHSDEGTNDMIYNRCVGTRYCANNCPYKVRRFNWFNYIEDYKQPRSLQLNPDVALRFRGVMEKCTLCIHRIRFSKYRAKIQDRKLKDGELQTACMQSCPTNAIVFGDLNDPESGVSKQFNQPQTYALLDELNTQPRVRFQVKVRNSNELKGDTKKHEGNA